MNGELEAPTVEVNDQGEELIQITEDNVGELTVDQKREALQDLENQQFELPDLEEEDAPSEVDELKQRIAQLEADKKADAKKIGRMGNELGEKRKLLQQRLAENQQRIEDAKANAFSDIADKGYDAIEQHQATVQETQAINQQLNQINHEEKRLQNQQLVQDMIGDTEGLGDYIAKAIEEDGYTPEQAKSADVLSLDAPVLVNLFRRAALLKRVEELEGKVNSSKDDTFELLQNVDRAAKKGRVTGRAGASAPVDRAFDPKMMTREQKEAFLAKYQAQKAKRR